MMKQVDTPVSLSPTLYLLAVTSLSTWLCLVTELLVCAVHPFPGDIQVYMLTVTGKVNLEHIDGILSVLMMFRLYLVGKVPLFCFYFILTAGVGYF